VVIVEGDVQAKLRDEAETLSVGRRHLGLKIVIVV
jgi:hypothetical protein